MPATAARTDRTAPRREASSSTPCSLPRMDAAATHLKAITEAWEDDNERARELAERWPELARAVNNGAIWVSIADPQ